MATQKQVEIPTDGIVRIIPFNANNIVGNKNLFWGNESRTGIFTQNGVKKWGTEIRDLVISGGGQLLDMSNDGQRELLDIYLNSDQWRNTIANSKDNRTRATRYYILNPEIEATKYLAESESADILRAEIRGLTKDKLERFGLVFGITGTETVVRAKLRQKTDTEKGRKELEKVMLSPDRSIIELVYFAESVGNSQDRTGLYKTKNGIWFWNGTSIANSREGVILFLKGREQHQEMLLIEMKQMLNKPNAGYEEAVIIPDKPQMSAEQKTLGDTEKVLTAWEKSDKENTNDTMTKIGKETGVHWKSVGKILKDAGKIS